MLLLAILFSSSAADDQVVELTGKTDARNCFLSTVRRSVHAILFFSSGGKRGKEEEEAVKPAG